VPPFGSALYHLAAPLPRTHRDPGPWYFTEGIARKLDAIGIRNPSSDTKATVRQAAESFHERLLQAKFSAIVLDFDGTIAPAGLMPDQPLPKEITAALLPLLKKGVIVGIATGRGDSCHGNLAKSFPAAVWPQLLVSHYNGASVGNLRDLLKNPIEWPEDQALAAVAGELQADPLLAALARISFKNVQITLRPKSKNDARTVCRLVSARIARMGYVRLVTSSHSLDIVPAATTKLALIDHVRCNHGAESVILTVGDRGDLEGNDFQLLSEPLSLSVDRVSPDLRTCWNFLPYDVSHFAGTSHYLQHTQTNQGTFRFRPK
jgi:hydroxymethylpyrimidine pyrophosphatase-like HAD family hydrolase